MIIWDPKVFRPNVFMEPIFLTKYFWTQNWTLSYLDPNFFFEPPYFWNEIVYFPESFFDPKYLGPKTFLDPNILLSKYSMVQNKGGVTLRGCEAN